MKAPTWQTTTTRELIRDGVLEIGDGYRARNSEFSGQGLPFLRIGNIGVHGINLSGANLLPVSLLDKLGGKVSQAGDSAIATKATIGRLAFIDEGTPRVVYSPQVSYWRVLRPDLIEPQFLRYWLQSKEFITQAIQTKGSTSMADYINLHDQRLMAITLPPLATQRAIAAVLSGHDELIDNNLRRIQILQDISWTTYLEWFVDRRFPGHEDLGLVKDSIPEGWHVTPLAELCSRIQAGSTPLRSQPEYWEAGDIDWYKTGELQDSFLLGSHEKISKAAPARMFEPGTILMAIYGSPTVGRLGIVTSLCSSNQAALGLVADTKKVSPITLFHLLKDKREHLNQIAHGAAQQNISKEKVEKTVVLVPPRSLINHFDQYVQPMWDLTLNLQGQNEKLRKARTLLLPKLISGDIDVSELDIGASWLAA